MKKFLVFSISTIFYYLLLTVIIFSFSYLSLVYGKTYDIFWIKSIQKKIYTRGYRNIWQYNKSCASFDKNLLYKPNIGKCNFLNPEFKTELNFNEFTRLHNIEKNYLDKNEYVLVLGDSIAMGWGVNDDKTFPYLLEKLLNKRVYNLAVSSYGTVREVKRMKLSPYYENSKTIIIQYSSNDIYENQDLNFNKTYSESDYKEFFDNEEYNLSSFKFILRNYKSSIRLFFSDIIDLFTKKGNIHLINFDKHREYLEKVIKENIDLENKEVIVFIPLAPYEKVVNFKKSSLNIKYFLIELKKEDFFIIDEHPNEKGQYKIAKNIFDFLKNN